MTVPVSEQQLKKRYFARQMKENLPPPKPPHQMLQIIPGAHLTRMIRLVKVLQTDSHTPKNVHKRAIHIATTKGLDELLRLRCHGMTIRQMETFLYEEVFSSPDKLRVIRLALYAIDRHLRKELNLAQLHETRLLAKQLPRPHN